MSRKAFLIWGLVIFHLVVALMGIAANLTLSRLIDFTAISSYIFLAPLIMPILAFGPMLYFRLRSVGRRRRVLLACLLFYVLSFIIGSAAVMPYLQIVGFQARGLDPIVFALAGEQPITTWMKMRFTLILCSAYYVILWGFFALLWFGSLDPRKPSQNRVFNALEEKLARLTNRQTHLSADLKTTA